MYNVDFEVKYKDIENELLAKIAGFEAKEKNKRGIQTDKLGKLGYTVADVHLICEKLYRDELLSVFYDNLEDDKLRSIEQIMFKNTEFMAVANTFHDSQYHFSAESGNAFFLFFNYDLFHILHKCICDQIKTEKVSPNLLEELRTQIEKFSV